MPKRTVRIEILAQTREVGDDDLKVALGKCLGRLYELGFRHPESEGQLAALTIEEEDGAADSRWKLKTSPEDYLERHPDGPNAALAREVLGIAG